MLAPSPETDALALLLSGADLSRAQMGGLVALLVKGEMPEPVIAAMLTALRFKGETQEELIGAAHALRAADAPFARPDYLFADTCGTGGTGGAGAEAINISTAVGFVSAAVGLPVVKHGNRSFSSKCGSADVLERLGASIEASAEVSRKALDESGFCFLFAPLYHPGLKHAGPVRRMMKVRTVFNLLGPCLNPAEPKVQLLGVAEERLLDPIAAALASLGVERALVVHGGGLDEIALHAPTQAVLVREGKTERIVLRPEDAGLRAQGLEGLAGGGPEENADRLHKLLNGRGAQIEAEAVAVNAGALLWLAGLAPDFRAGVEQALDALASGSPGKVLETYIAATRRSM